jgi:RND family efflux transporter MFP subunit
MNRIAILLCIAAVILPAGCKDKVRPGSAKVERQVLAGLKFVSVPLSQVDSFYETSGTIRPKTTSVISSRIMGTVTTVKVRQGDQVKFGDLLVTIDDRDVAQRTVAAEAGYKEARSALEAAEQNRSLSGVTYERYRNLFMEKAISRQEMDEVETRKKLTDSEYERTSEKVNRAGAMLEEARVFHGFAKITAPSSGMVIDRKIDQGSMASPGMPLLVLEDTSQLKVEAYVDENRLGKFRIGIPAYVIPDGTGVKISGIIGEIVPAVDPASRTYLIKVYVEGRSLKTGMYVKVLIPEGKKEVLLVPKKAVVERGQLAGVFVKDDSGVVTYRLIKIGMLFGDNVEVLSGLKAGESIVVEGMEKAVDGGVVKQ